MPPRRHGATICGARAFGGAAAWLPGFLMSSLLLPGCAHLENQFAEDGPSVSMDHNSPTAADVVARYQPAEPRLRNWEVTPTQSERGAVTHAPGYFEDPFEDKGSGRTDYRMGWEDVVATPYGYARYTLNGLLLPVSMIVTPPWTEMESDGRLSRQALGYDHDPERTAGRSGPQAPPAADPQPDAAPSGGDRGAGSASGTGGTPRMNRLIVTHP